MVGDRPGNGPVFFCGYVQGQSRIRQRKGYAWGCTGVKLNGIFLYAILRRMLYWSYHVRDRKKSASRVGRQGAEADGGTVAIDGKR